MFDKVRVKLGLDPAAKAAKPSSHTNNTTTIDLKIAGLQSPQELLRAKHLYETGPITHIDSKATSEQLKVIGKQIRGIPIKISHSNNRNNTLATRPDEVFIVTSFNIIKSGIQVYGHPITNFSQERLIVTVAPKSNSTMFFLGVGTQDPAELELQQYHEFGVRSPSLPDFQGNLHRFV